MHNYAIAKQSIEQQIVLLKLDYGMHKLKKKIKNTVVKQLKIGLAECQQ